MNPVTHLLASWSVADVLGLRGRDRVAVTWCGVLPDADGLGLLVDGANRLLGQAHTWHYYGAYHHALLHGLFAAVMIPLTLSIFAVNRLRACAAGSLVVHIHFLCDVAGSRGPDLQDLWPLDAWPNIAITLLLVAFAPYRAVGEGCSPLGVFSAAGDRVFVEKVRGYWRTLRQAG